VNKKEINGESINKSYLERNKKMSSLNQMELQNLRHFIGAQTNAYSKFTHYADSAVDPQIKQVLNKAAQDALSSKQKLMSFLV
jgi:hypothetical protein